MKATALLLIAFLAACGAAEEPDGGIDTPAKTEVDEDDTRDDDPTDEALDDDPEEPMEDPVEDPVDDPIEDPADGTMLLSRLYEPLFVASGCTAGYCHGTFGSADAVFELVGADATQPVCGRTKFIVPGEPEQSILWLRVRDTTDEDIECGVVKMPRDRTEPLDAQVTQMLHDWIAQGAHR